jgi:peptidyl-prolyl cis-trans isomerase B (cyclophilin B)
MSRGSRIATAVTALAFVLAGCGSSTPASPAAATDAGPKTSCSYPARGSAAKQVGPPPVQEPNTGTATVALKLTSGTITLTLDRSSTPCTVGSFVHLARSGYFDGTPCHRLTASETLRVLQCGDPTGSGTGGPGYVFPDETRADMTYRTGTVAMANAGPGTNGSQFFLVYGDSQLPPQYTVFGSITGGLDVLQQIGAAGTESGGPDGAPKTPVRIETASVS